MEDIRPPVILDEIQNVPEILNYVRTRIDAAPGREDAGFSLDRKRRR
jgi:predicted AAA+ superfamily ATPase